MPSSSKHKHRQQRKVINPWWSDFTEGILHSSIRSAVATVGVRAARYPFTTVAITVGVSIALLVIGFFTNFYLELDQLVFLTPTGSLPLDHHNWIDSPESGFPPLLPFFFVIHLNGNNVLMNTDAVKVALNGMKVLHETDDFLPICSESSFIGSNGEPTCWTSSVTSFWDHQMSVFEEQLEQVPSNMTQDEWVRTAVSASTYPDNTPVFHEAILGHYQGYNTTTGQQVNYTDSPPISLSAISQALNTDNQLYIESAQSLVMKIDIPHIGKRTDDLEARLVERLASFRDEINGSDGVVVFEYFTMNAYQNEMMRALYIDMPLVAVLVVVMVVFTALIFYDRHEPVKSRGLVGLHCMTSIGLSMAAGYGLMWCIGVPMTTVGIMIPFVVVGVGLDDAFIITGTYFRLMRENPIIAEEWEEKIQHILNIIQQTLEEVGVSITMTTTTTLLCFLLGSVSSIPAVRWLCWYAAAAMGVVYIYQLTCFVALLMIDEQRVQANRRDLCYWIVVDPDGNDEDGEVVNNELKNGDFQHERVEKTNTRDSSDDDADERESADNEAALKSSCVTIDSEKEEGKSGDAVNLPHGARTVETPASEEQQEEPKDTENLPQTPLSERIMGWYADQLLKPLSKAIVLLVFAAYFGGSVYSTTLLYQEFNTDDYIPADSFMASFMNAYRDYSTVFRYMGVYFRNVDQADPEIQKQMIDYVEELSQLSQVGEEPAFFWLRDFEQLTTSEQAEELPVDVSSLSFNQQVDFALSVPQLHQIYGQDIVQDPVTENITASRTFLYLRHVDMYDPVQTQLKMLTDQREITLRQAVNQPDKRVNNELSFFTFDNVYFYWETYDRIVDELIYTTVSCVIVVSVIALLMIPHWTSLAFVCPLLIMLYFNLLGTMQYCGIKVNSIFYFIVIMSIGLLVDFLMHILLRYYETPGKTRHEKVKQTLETMGVPIMLGGFTTFLGVLPLAFSTTKIFITVFISFLAMVVLGCLAGLVFLPVLLSIVGPVVTISSRSNDGNDKSDIKALSIKTGGIEPGSAGEKSLRLCIDGVVYDVTEEVEC